MTRMMQSDMVSPFRRTFCNRRHVSASICISQFPLGKRFRASSNGNSAAIRARHSSVISISGIALVIRGPVLAVRVAIARTGKIIQLNRRNLPQGIDLRHLQQSIKRTTYNMTVNLRTTRGRLVSWPVPVAQLMRGLRKISFGETSDKGPSRRSRRMTRAGGPNKP